MKKISFALVMLSLTSLQVKAQTRETITELENQYQNCLDKGVDMLGCSKRYYNQMDSLLNAIYNKHKKMMLQNEFATLKKEQLEWLKKRDAYFKNMQLEPEERQLSKDDKEMVLIDKRAAFVQKRVIELIESRKIRINMELHEIWHPDQSDTATLNQYGNVTLEFKPDGQLTYTIYESGKAQHIYLVYEVVNNKLITDQPSAPQREETHFSIKDNKLELYFGGTRSCYIKE